MKNILNTYYGKKLSLRKVSTDLFSDVDNVSVACVKINNLKDAVIENISFISINEGESNAQVLLPKEYLKDDGKYYVILINHPGGCMAPSPQDMSLYRSYKRITENCDVVIVSKDKKVFLSVNQMLKDILF